MEHMLKNMFRYTDGHTICSAAITNTGQVLTKQSIEFVNEKVDEINKMSKEELEQLLDL